LVYKEELLVNGHLVKLRSWQLIPFSLLGKPCGVEVVETLPRPWLLSLIGLEVLGFIAHLFFSDRTAGFLMVLMEGQRAVRKSIGCECLLVTIP